MEIILPEKSGLAELRECIVEERKSRFYETLVCISLALMYIALIIWVIVTIVRLIWT